jgi:hypothetical protein
MKRTAAEQEDAEGGADARKSRPANRPKVERIYITPCDENDEAAGESHAIPKSVDYERYIKKNFPEGRYKVEARKGGQLPPLWSTFVNNVPPAAALADTGDGDEGGEDLGDDLSLELSLEAEDRIARKAARAALLAVERARPPAQSNTLQESFAVYDAIVAREERNRARLLEEIRAQTPPPARVERAPRAEVSDPVMTLAAEVARSNPDLAARVVESVFPSGDGDGLPGQLFRAAAEHPQIVNQVLNTASAVAQRIAAMFAPKQPAPQPGGATAPLTAPAVELPPSIQSALGVVCDEALNYVPGEDDDELSDEVARARDAVMDAIKADPQHALALGLILNATPGEIVNILSGRVAPPIPGCETMRLRGFHYIAKKKDADMFFRELKAAIVDANESEEAAQEDVPEVANNGTRARAGV